MDGTSRLLGDDCGGRPRQWVDERLLVIERFARLNTIALIDTVTGVQRELLESAERSVKNPRVSPDGRWIAFDAAPPGESPSVLVAPLGEHSTIPESAWVMVDCSASHPFWSADGRWASSPRARRSSWMHEVSAESLTAVPGHTRRKSSSLEMTSPARSASTHRTDKDSGVTRTSSPPRQSP